MKSLNSQNYYEILGVAREAAPGEIRKAYEMSRITFQKNSMATYSLFTDEENQEILALISRAYETLFNTELRREYDTFLDSLEEERPAREPPPIPTPTKSSLPPWEQRTSTQPPLRDTAGAGTAQEPPLAQGVQEPEQEGRKDEAMEDYIRSITAFNGLALKKVRQMRGLSIDDIAERTKIRKTYIQYIEEENFTFLPADVYVKGFITIIAGLLELPTQRVAEDYMQSYRAVRSD